MPGRTRVLPRKMAARFQAAIPFLAEILAESPVAAAHRTAGGTLAGELPAAAIDHLGEFAADFATLAIFAVGDDIAAIGTVIPGITAADRALEAGAVGAGRVRTVIAIHVAGNG